MKKEHEDGSELHRLRPMQEGYDPKVFNRLYKLCKPVIRNLVRQIDCSRYKVTPDIITSYFYDKMLYVFNKYYGTCSEAHLQARILTSIKTFKNKLLRSAYGEMAEFNQAQDSLEVLFDNNKEDQVIDDEESQLKEMLFKKVEDYMKEKLTEDGWLIFEILYNTPESIKEWFTSTGKITNINILDFFEMPRTKASLKYISDLRKDVDYWIERAKVDLV